MALAAGADMPLAQGTREEQLAVLAAIEAAQADGSLDPQRLARSEARLDALAARFPATPREMSPTQRIADESLMRRRVRRTRRPGCGRPRGLASQ
jgi:beta-N-acetylhexosaminidase